jgi:hypothetical protein
VNHSDDQNRPSDSSEPSDPKGRPEGANGESTVASNGSNASGSDADFDLTLPEGHQAPDASSEAARRADRLDYAVARMEARSKHSSIEIPAWDRQYEVVEILDVQPAAELGDRRCPCCGQDGDWFAIFRDERGVDGEGRADFEVFCARVDCLINYGLPAHLGSIAATMALWRGIYRDARPDAIEAADSRIRELFSDEPEFE